MTSVDDLRHRGRMLDKGIAAHARTLRSRKRADIALRPQTRETLARLNTERTAIHAEIARLSKESAK